MKNIDFVTHVDQSSLSFQFVEGHDESIDNKGFSMCDLFLITLRWGREENDEETICLDRQQVDDLIKFYNLFCTGVQ
jgi:hypothetical protein